MNAVLQAKRDNDADNTALVCDFLRATEDIYGYLNDALVGNFDDIKATDIVDIMESMDDAQLGRLYRERIVSAYLKSAIERRQERNAARREYDNRESPESLHGVASLFRNNDRM